MKISILKAIQIATTKKDFLIYTIENNEVKDFCLTNDLTRHRKKFGKETKFLLTEIAKQQLQFLTINL
jgi:hypothetical protein